MAIKILKRSLIVLASLLALLSLALFIVLRFFEDEIVDYAMEKVKTQFVTRVETGDVHLVFWKTFPHTSLEFNQVLIEETFAAHDTLIYADKVFLEFNVMDLFRGNYTIHSVDVSGASCTLRRNAKGEDNWHFWKTDAADTSKFGLELREVLLEKSRVIYDDRSSGFALDIYSDKSRGKGDFGDTRFTVSIDLRGRMHHLYSGGESYAPNSLILLEGELDADTETEVYAFRDCKMQVGKMPLLVNGEVNTSAKSSVDITVKGDGLELGDILASMETSGDAITEDYDPSGEVEIDLQIKGETYGDKIPLMDLHLVMHDGEMNHRSSGVSLQNIDCDLQYNKSKKSDLLTLRKMSCNLGEGFISASGNIRQIAAPELDLQVETQVDLFDLKNFFALDTLQICQGQVLASASIKGKLNYVEADSSYDWRSLVSSGKASLSNGLIRLKNSNREFSSLGAEVVFDKNNASVRNLSGVVNGSDFRINGELTNLIPFLASSTESLSMDARLQSKTIDFTNLVETSQTTTTDNNYRFELPQRISFRIQTSVEKFVFRKFEATELSGLALYSGGRLTIDPLAFKTADGSFSAQLIMERDGQDFYRINSLANLKSININKLFTEFENFDQTFIQDKHLRGDANATVQLRARLTTGLEMLPETVESLIDVNIENGQLIGLESLQDIAEYIRGNKWMAPFVNEDKFAERMRDISFSKLENVIEIRNRMITIPLMDIHSSAMDISAKGSHSFDNRIDYAIGFNLRDILVKKEKEWQEADDGLGKRLFISMKGSTDDPQFSMDKELAKEIRQEEMAQEKQNVKALLKEELGLFRKDASVGSYKEEQNNPGTVTTLEWDDMDAPKEKPDPAVSPVREEKRSEEKPTEEKPKKKVPKWLEEKE